MRASVVAWAGLAVLTGGCGREPAHVVPAAVEAPVKVARCVMKYPDVQAGRLARARLDRDLAHYLAGRPGRVVYAAHDLVSGVRLGRGEQQNDLITASGAKVDILTALLAARPGGLDEGERDLAERMITESDNSAADALWSRVGGGGAMSEFYRRAGLSRTAPGPSVYWGGTTTSPSDRLRLLKLLVKGGRGLSAEDRGLVLGLMGRVQRDQAWGVSAAARSGDRVALKNGWTPRPFIHNTWAVTSYGRVSGPGRDLLLSVQTDRQPGEGAGIETIEGVARMIGTRLDGLRPTLLRPCPTNPIP
ncbi:serine hydrolase [Actinomadura sp. ATCC 31491]|uniref:Serine hydrolase n=1 Tax=Actinomadura luzonensis TaxID=2805427 RepID=A0ABT0GBM6_9ACTN|nr:serine hydrolase [Actinomadura luzonensis]MCK2221476.1 serine hydrolase [Actinomadura luzonensis]